MMVALSIRQPWAWLIVRGFKPIENRTWPTRYRGRLFIHAAKGMTWVEYGECLKFSLENGVPLEVFPKFNDLVRGGIVGEATLTDCVQASGNPWFCGPRGFVLANAKPLPFFACNGTTGIFACEFLPESYRLDA